MNRRSFVAAGFAAAISPRAATKRLLDQIRDGGYALLNSRLPGEMCEPARRK